MTEETIQQPVTDSEKQEKVVPIEEQITQELVKHNVTEALIADLKQMYMPLVLKDLNDKETYVAIKEGRKHCKQVRVTAEKLCKKGREDATAIQKAWIAKEKDVAGRIGEVEDHLEKQEKEFEAEQEKQKALRKRQQEEQLIRRQTQLTNMGALYSDGSFALGETSFELSLVKECEEDIWQEQILPKFRAEYEKVEAERIAADERKQEYEEKLKRQQEDMQRKQKELEQREADLKKAEDERIEREKTEKEREIMEAKRKQQEVVANRCTELRALGLEFNFPHDSYVFEDVNVHITEIKVMTDDEWIDLIRRISPVIQQRKDAAEQKRLAEIEDQKKRALGQSRLKSLKDLGLVPLDATDITLSDMTEEEYDTLYKESKREYEAAKRVQWEHEQEEKKKLEEQKESQRLLEANEKEKWQDILGQLDALVIHKFKSGQYAKKAAILREKLEEVRAL
jgi:hypothetical protein